jgi:hypothetical protein
MLSKRQMYMGIGAIIVVIIIVAYMVYRRRNLKIMMKANPELGSSDGGIFMVEKQSKYPKFNDPKIVGKKVYVHSKAVGNFHSVITGWFPGADHEAITGVQVKMDKNAWPNGTPSPQYSPEDYVVISL